MVPPSGGKYTPDVKPDIEFAAGPREDGSLTARAGTIRLKIDWDVPIRMDDGLELRADVFRPDDAGRYPAILTYGPYGKGLAFQDGYKTAWEIMARENPDVLAGSSNRYQNWEVVDPEKWVPDGYAIVRVDSRGAGRSPGYLCHNASRETRDAHLCVEWAAAQPWCSGKVGMNGISYYASNQWRTAASRPPHLAAICVWEGWNDSYREGARHGGMICSFRKNWQDMQVKTVQHGYAKGAKSRVTGEPVCGPEVLGEAELEKNRENMWQEILSRELDGPYYRERSADLSQVGVPLLTAANWGGQGLHTRGNFEGFMRAASKEKWLEVHGGSHWAPFYTDYGVALQKKFLGYLPEGREERLGQAAARAAQRAPSGREVRAALRERMAARPHEVDPVLFEEGFLPQ